MAEMHDGEQQAQLDYQARVSRSLLVSAIILLVALVADHIWPGLASLPSGQSLPRFVSVVTAILCIADIAVLALIRILKARKRPLVEAVMVARILRVGSVLGIVLAVTYCLGKLAAFGAVFAMFGGMLLGWSLQAPVSGFAAWVLISLKRPFRPGDRIQFPNLGLVGDVKETGLMYTILNQVGGTIGSEEAVGRHILVPNAMLFGQVVINYTVRQEAAYMLDEVVTRITYDSDWDKAERILLDAAVEMTADIVEATGTQPYIRSDFYDYGVYMRLRYQTRVKERVEIVHRITKKIFQDIQKTPSVDLAIPFIYSYRTGAETKEEGDERKQDRNGLLKAVREIEIGRVTSRRTADPDDVAQIANSVSEHGLLQPIVVTRLPGDGGYEILAGHLRFEACKSLGWKMIPAVVRERT